LSDLSPPRTDAASRYGMDKSLNLPFPIHEGSPMPHPRKKRFFDPARETMPWERREEELHAKLVRTLSHAYEHSVAYKEIFGAAGVQPTDIRTTQDVERLPILRVSDLVERQKRQPPFGGFDAAGPRRVNRIFVNSGLVFQPGGQWEYNDQTWSEALCGAGFQAGDLIINTFNYHLWPFSFTLEECAKRIGATVIPAGAGNTMMQVKIIQMLKVNGFLGTPSFLMTLAQRAQGMGLDLKRDIHLDTALVTAEMLPESLRARLEETFDVILRQAYGTVFLGCIGYECPERSGLHIPDGILVEVVDPNSGKRIPHGTAGEIVATSFNPTYPMIRMATGDLSAMTEDPCPCGRTGPRLRRIIGRIDQATKVKGTFVHPWQTDDIISRHPEVYKYQVVITRENHTDVMTFLVELKEDVSERRLLRTGIERELEEMLALKGVVRVVPRGTLPDHHKKIEDQRKWDEE